MLPPSSSSATSARALVVLGCRVRLDARGRLASGPLAARVEAAAVAYVSAPRDTIVVASGGRRWGRHVEADVMARELALRGVPESAIVRERSSLRTRDNARFSALLLARRGVASADVVTNEWHLPRALALFRLHGLNVSGVAARPDPATPIHVDIWHRGRERLLICLQGAFKGDPAAGTRRHADER